MENSNGRHGPETAGKLAACQESTRDNKGEGRGGGLGALAQRLSCDYLLEAEGIVTLVDSHSARDPKNSSDHECGSEEACKFLV